MNVQLTLRDEKCQMLVESECESRGSKVGISSGNSINILKFHRSFLKLKEGKSLELLQQFRHNCVCMCQIDLSLPKKMNLANKKKKIRQKKKGQKNTLHNYCKWRENKTLRFSLKQLKSQSLSIIQNKKLPVRSSANFYTFYTQCNINNAGKLFRLHTKYLEVRNCQT